MELETGHIIMFVVILLLIFYGVTRTEGYRPNTFCSNCHNLTRKECENCPNCGYCVDDQGNGTCVSGDPASPYYYDKCMAWKHRDKDAILAANNGVNPYDCDYERPYDARVRTHRKFATGWT